VTETDVQNSHQRQGAEDSQQSTQDAQQKNRIRELEERVERYRQASEDALQQLDWCIGYMHGCGKKGIARSLARNRSYIRTQLLRRAEVPVPSEQPDER
jgi:hypothetical protein